jgi:hypothetical protein
MEDRAAGHMILLRMLQVLSILIALVYVTAGTLALTIDPNLKMKIAHNITLFLVFPAVVGSAVTILKRRDR